MVIERLQKADIPALLELYKELIEFDNTVLMANEVYDKMLDDDNYLLLVAKDGDNLAGSVLGIVCGTITVMGMPFLVVEDVIVSEKYRRKGVGRLLFDKLDLFAKEKNCSYSILCSSGFRKGAHSFCESVGYTDDVRGFRKIYI